MGRLLGLEPAETPPLRLILRNKGRVSRRPFSHQLPVPAYGGWIARAETKGYQ